jgi:hypothetical protein
MQKQPHQAGGIAEYTSRNRPESRDREVQFSHQTLGVIVLNWLSLLVQQGNSSNNAPNARDWPGNARSISYHKLNW